MGALGYSSDTLYAFYDLKVSPASFDFLIFLQLAEMRRCRLNYKKLKIIVVSASDEFTFREDKFKSTEMKQMMLRNVVIPMCNLVPSCHGVDVLTRRSELAFYWSTGLARANVFPRDYTPDAPIADYGYQGINAAYLRDERISCFTAPPEHRAMAKRFLERHSHGKKVVTITLREASHQLSRNSQLDGWVDFLDWLPKSEYCPVIIRDAEQLYGDLPCLGNYVHADFAAGSILFRAALYEEAYINMFVNNGPTSLCRMMNARSLSFRLVNEEHESASAAWIGTRIGLEVGKSQFHAANKSHRCSWKSDSFKHIKQSFLELRNLIERRADLSKPNGCASTIHALHVCHTALQYTFAKLCRSVEIEDLQTLAEIERTNSMAKKVGLSLPIRKLFEEWFFTQEARSQVIGNIYKHCRLIGFTLLLDDIIDTANPPGE